MAAVGCLTYEFQVTLPYMAARALHAGSRGFGFMTAAMGVGAVIGGLVVATRGRTGTWPLVLAATAFGTFIGLAALAPDLPLELIALALAGAASISFMSTGNATLQLRADPGMRGRVMSLWFVAFQGSTPIGGPAIGAVMSGFGARAGLGVGAITCFAVAVIGAAFLRGRLSRPVRARSPELGPT
jgi:MFS family permease